MPAVATCPHCKLEMDVPRDLRGQEVECPGCLKPFHPDGPPKESPPQEAELPQPPPLPTAGVTGCPQCGVEMDIPADLSGKEVECPACLKIFMAVAQAEGAATPAETLPVVQSSRRRRRYEDDGGYDDDYDRRSPERRKKDAMARLRPAAIAMIIVGVLRLLSSGLWSAVAGFGIFQNANPNILILVGVVGIFFVLAALQVYGAWQMLNARSYAWGLVSGILLILPACDYPCTCISWFFYLAFAIWGLVVINDSDVRWLIRQRNREEHEMERRED